MTWMLLCALAALAAPSEATEEATAAQIVDQLWELEWDLLGRFDMRRRGIENEDDEN